jgi:PKD repeat protein
VVARRPLAPLLLALGFGLGGVCPAAAQEPLFTFAQISDSQPETPEQQALFERVLDAIVAAGSPGALLPHAVDFVLFPGDLVSNGETPSEWEQVVAALDAKLTAQGVPYLAVPGNHDVEEGGIGNYERFVADSRVWNTDSATVYGQNGRAVFTGWSGLRIVGFNNSNGAWNQISAEDLAEVSARLGAASAAGENVFLLGHHPHDEFGPIPLAEVLEDPSICCYARGHSGSPGARRGLAGVANPGVWDLDSNSIFAEGAILYYEAYATELRVSVIELYLNPTELPAPKTIELAYPLRPAAASVPTADFSAAPVSGSAPLAVAFTDLSSGSPTSWSWSFGDGASSTERHPIHTYAAPGVYDVTLVASNPAGSSTKLQAGLVQVAPPPALQTFFPAADARVKSSSPTGNYGSEPELRVRAGDPTHRVYLRFAVSGVLGAPVESAKLRLFATDPSDDGGALYPAASGWSESGITWANAPPIAGTPLAGPAPAVAGQWREIDLTSAVAGDGVYAFALDSASTNSAYYSSREGANPPELVVTTRPLAPPSADFAGAPTEGSAPLEVAFTDLSAGGPTSWLWDFGDGATSMAQSPSHSYGAPGVYDVSLTVSNGDGSDSIMRPAYVQVAAPPPPVADFSASPLSGETPLRVEFTDLSSGGPTSWLWDFGDGATSTEQHPSHTYTAPGVYDVTLVVASSGGPSALARPGYVNVAQGVFVLSLAPTADASVGAAKPNRNYGAAPSLKVKTGVWRSFLRFDVAGLEAPVLRATLRLFVGEGSSDGGALYQASDAWSEGSITWNTAPPLSGAPIAQLGPVAAGTWVEVDVTALVATDGTYAFGLESASTNLAYYESREGANAPQLVIEVAE